MKILGAMFNKISGPDATATYKVEFVVDESQRSGVKELLDFKKGTSVILAIHEINEIEKIQEIVNETPEETKKRYYKRMHALINEIARNKSMDAADIKTSLKAFLLNKNYIKESTKDLTVEGLAAAIHYLLNEYEK